MSIRFRQSMKLLPGLRLNFSKETVGLSFGVPGARYTINSKGRRTVSTGIPGTGLYNVDTLSSGTRRSSAATQSQESDTYQGPPAPGLFELTSPSIEYIRELLSVKLAVTARVALELDGVSIHQRESYTKQTMLVCNRSRCRR